jgi:hypothetical protein
MGASRFAAISWWVCSHGSLSASRMRLNPRVVHEDVRLRKLFHHPGGERLPAGRRADVRDLRLETRMRGPRLAQLFRAPAADNHVAARLQESFGKCEPDARCAAGDDHGVIG